MRKEELTGARILIVDDEPANVRVLERMLGRAGYTDLVATTDPRRTLPLFLERQPDLILLDLLMPYQDGFAVMEELTPYIGPETYLPILVLTADVTPAARQRALSAGAKDFLTKPFDQTEMLLRIRNLLETRLLHLQLARRNQLLERLNEEVHEALRARDATLSAITHDLGQPLATIGIAARILERQTSAPEGDAAEGLRIIDLSVARMQSMIGELLDLARLEAGKPLELHYRPVDLVTIVRAETETQRQTAPRHRITVTAEPLVIAGEWDPERLTRVIANLLSNAVKFSPNGGEITITACRRQDQDRDWAEVQVRDEGIGIPAADLPHVFDRFRRGSNVAGRIPGTGLGLAGARQIVIQHGGKMTIDSHEGGGTTVTLRLPLD